ncbi:phytochrome A1-like [Tasmannia lanceolata]|uniref:phytochrome A1-like n=1 Tax=Tasmannia lanceolata TaxID=3420 RepID=UPI004063B75E
MSTSKATSSASSSGRTKQSDRVIAQTNVDAKLNAEFEESESSFDYLRSVSISTSVLADQPRSEKVAEYLQQIQKGKLIQPFGCLLAIDEKTFRVIAYSENAPEMLTMVNHAIPSVSDHPVLGIRTDVRTIFTPPSAAALEKAFGFGEISLLNPILVHCKTSNKPFYAIIHRVTGGLIIDFEPVKPYEAHMTSDITLQSYKLAAKAIARLQSLPGGSMKRLVDTVVQEVYELTGYDRVMAYKFHEDDHGEVISEVTKPGLEPYLGLHYPATDIPQAARFLFMKNIVRMICDCNAKPTEVYQDEKLTFDLTLCGSTLRAPHSCHVQFMANMGSIASLVMAVVINEGEEQDENLELAKQQQHRRKRLWGLVVCHHTTPRFVPFPLRYACEFLTQVFAIHVSRELQLENQIQKKNILRIQTLLCDMLMRAAPLGIVTQSPSIIDLVKCDGAALLYQNQIWRLGVAPSESQIHDIALWLSEFHMDSTGLSTESLHDAGYPGALSLSDALCGMAAVRINSKDKLFWFRSHTVADVRWGGAKHDPNQKDDGRRMHPRSSFKAFLEVVRTKSLPWLDFEMDAIHSLQLILRGSFKDAEKVDTKTMIHSQVSDLKLEGIEELQAVTNEMVRLIYTATVPILAVDVNGLVNGWNTKIAEVTGLSVDQVMGEHLLTFIEDSSVDTVKRMLNLALEGQEEQNVQFEMKTDSSLDDSGPIILVVNACAIRDLHENVVGVYFVAQDMTSHKIVMDKFTRIECDYKAIVQNPSPLIPPLFGADEFGWCSEWNTAMTKLTGWERDDIIDKMLLGEVFGTQMACCRLKNQDAFVNLGVAINNAMMGQECEKIPFAFFSRNGKYVDCLLSINKKVNGEGVVTGIFCFLSIHSQELQQAHHVQRLSEQTALNRVKELAYIRQEIKNPLSGIIFSGKLLEGTGLSEEQKQLIYASTQCQHQLNKILDDLDLENITNGNLNLEIAEFTLQDVLITAVSQVMITSKRKGIQIVCDPSEEFMNECIYGDNLRLQQIVAAFLFVTVKYTPRGGQIEISGSLTKDPLGERVHLVHLELRISHSGVGIPIELLSQMFENGGDITEGGISLLICRKLLTLMNGDVRYLNEEDQSTFVLSAELTSAQKSGRTQISRDVLSAAMDRLSVNSTSHATMQS